MTDKPNNDKRLQGAGPTPHRTPTSKNKTNMQPQTLATTGHKKHITREPPINLTKHQSNTQPPVEIEFTLFKFMPSNILGVPKLPPPQTQTTAQPIPQTAADTQTLLHLQPKPLTEPALTMEPSNMQQQMQTNIPAIQAANHTATSYHQTIPKPAEQLPPATLDQNQLSKPESPTSNTQTVNPDPRGRLQNLGTVPRPGHEPHYNSTERIFNVILPGLAEQQSLTHHQERPIITIQTTVCLRERKPREEMTMTRRTHLHHSSQTRASQQKNKFKPAQTHQITSKPNTNPKEKKHVSNTSSLN